MNGFDSAGSEAPRAQREAAQVLCPADPPPRIQDAGQTSLLSRRPLGRQRKDPQKICRTMD